MASRRVRKDQ